MRRYCLFIATILSLLFTKVSATSIEVSGSVSGIWNADTVMVMGDLLVPDGQSLEISAGSKIIFWTHFKLEVQGKITAIGIPGDSIVFTIRDTANFYNQSTDRGGWFGIRFNQTSIANDTSQFSYCRFEFGKALGDSADQYGGAIFAKKFSKLKISNCLFYSNYSFYSGGAVYLWNSDARIENNTFKGNYSGNPGTIYGYGGGICAMHSAPKITSNTFTGNASTGVGGGVSFDDADPVFYDNVFDGNYSALGGALGVLRSSPTLAFSNLLITNNSSLYFGGGVCCIRSFPVFSNLTIADNSSSYGGGFYCNDSAAPSMYNSIIHGNSGLGISVYIWDIRSAPNFYYCDIEGDTNGFEGSGGHEGYHGIYQNNIDEVPEFYGTGLFPYQLAENSPIIDSGTPDASFLSLPDHDLGGAPRIWNNRIDMGAYEFNGTTGTTKPVESSGEYFSISPNPTSEFFCIDFQEPTTSTWHFRILNFQGITIAKFDIPAGCSHIILDDHVPGMKKLLSGIYLIEGTSGMEQSVKEIIKL